MPVLTKINTNSIAEDAITGDKFAGDAYLANTATQNISGTYSENRLYTSDAYTLSGNATVNSHLTLSSIKANQDIVLTAGGAYTLTGTGTLEAGSLMAEDNNLTGMTGELGSTITGSPALNLSNTTFPAGHVIQTVTFTQDTVHTVYSSTKVDVGLSTSITPSSVKNDILVYVDMEISPMYRNSIDGRGSAHLQRSASGQPWTVILSQNTLGFYFAGLGTDSNLYLRVGMHRMDSPATTTSVSYKIQVAKGNASHFSMNNSTGGSTITLMEIQR